jgi:hypothetical protein
MFLARVSGGSVPGEDVYERGVASREEVCLVRVTSEEGVQGGVPGDGDQGRGVPTVVRMSME